MKKRISLLAAIMMATALVGCGPQSDESTEPTVMVPQDATEEEQNADKAEEPKEAEESKESKESEEAKESEESKESAESDKSENSEKKSIFYDMAGTYTYDDLFSCGNNGTLEIKAQDGEIYVTDYVDEWEDYRFEITEDDIVKETEYGVYVKCSKVNEKSDTDYFYFETASFGIDVYCCDEEGNTTTLLYNAQ